MELNAVKEDVLIVGAGPAGLVLAIDLARRGIRALLVERNDRLSPGSRGSGLQPRTLEVFDDLGVIDEILAASGPELPVTPHEADGSRGTPFRLTPPADPAPGTPHPVGRTLEQWRTQEILHARLRALGGRVRFGAGLVALAQDAEGVTADLADGTRVRAAYAVGTDGGRSAVRAAIGVAMHGEGVDDDPKLVADVVLRDGALDRDGWHAWPTAPGGGVIIRPMPAAPDRYQVFVNAPGGGADVPELVGARTSLDASDVREVLWTSGFRARAALAERYRAGRVLLAGDAAHIHSPAGGQGLNTGVQDAYNLGWKLAMVLAHGAPDTLLDSYEAERRPIAEGVLGASTRIHRAGRGEDFRRPRQDASLRQLDLGYRGGPLSADEAGGGVLCAGDRAPDAALGDGRTLFDVLRGPHFTLLTGGGAAAPADLPAWIRTRPTDAFGPGLHLIRPDGYLGLTTREPSAVGEYLRRVAG